MSFVVFKDLELKYKTNSVATLKKLNVEIKEGEFIVVVGPSGCGKTSTLKVLSGLEDITSGEIIINGEVVNYKEPKDRSISMVFQNYALYPHFTVEKNVAFGLKKMGLSKAEVNEKVLKIGDMLGITDQFHKMPKDLSGGQQQRVALARAIVRSPEIYIFDEPLSNLDAKLRTKTREDIVNMHKTLKKTFFYVTHDQVEAMTMADRIIILKDGEIQQFDRPINIFYNPKNLFVAQFMGTPEINVFDAVVDETNLSFGADLKVILDVEIKKIIKEHKKVILGVRPDDIKYSLTPKEGYFKVDVKNREILGNYTILNCFTGDMSINIMIKTKDFIESMTNIYVYVDVRDCYLFDSETKLNLNA